MDWRDHLLRLLARGLRSRSQEEFEPDILICTLDRISEDSALSTRLDELGPDAVREAFLDLYEAERTGKSGV